MSSCCNRGKALIAAAFLCLSLTGCSARTGETAIETPAPTEEPVVETPEQTEEPAMETPAPVEEPAAEEVLFVTGEAEIREELLAAMRALRQPQTMDITAAGLENPEMDVKNIYYGITSQNPELKGAYDLTAELADGRLSCRLSYMPYKTQEFPEGFAGETAATLEALLAVADAHMGEETVPIRITDPALEPDTIKRVLQQVGGGYILCSLNRDATALVYSAPMGMSMADCMTALAQADELADGVIARVVAENMTPRERAEALYAYVTQRVSYDQRYYSDRAAMPYESQTALGALRDGVAICGGYSHAVKLLFEKAGIPCYNVTGRYFGENHMWNIARLDGEWLWFDATADRGSTGEFGFLRFAQPELDSTMYTRSDDGLEALLT